MAFPRPAIDVSTFLIDSGPVEEQRPFDWTQLFGNDNPVQLEIGCGKGLFLTTAAENEVSHNFLGVELAKKYARLAAERLARKGLANAKVWRGDARIAMGRLVPAASLRAVHVYFPDPWWKKRHKKRRVFNEALMAQIERALELNGELFVASDVEEYFLHIEGLIAASPQFRRRPAFEFAAAGETPEYLTNFERKYRIEGRTIYRAHHVRQEIGSASTGAGAGSGAPP